MIAFYLPWNIAVCWAMLVAVLGNGSVLAQHSAVKQRPQMLGTIKEKDVAESSGLAISGKTPDAFWTHNDSGNPADLFLIATTGKTLAKCKLKDASNTDWEAMSSFKRGDQDWLMVADVGDNSRNRTKLRLYLLLEPALSGKPKEKKKKRKKNDSGEKLKTDSISLTFKYEDGPHNTEAAAVTPDAKSVWLIEKIYSNDIRNGHPGIYSVPLEAADFAFKSDQERPHKTAVRLADYPIRNVTGMAFSPDGRRLIVRNYLNAHLFTRPEGQSWEKTVASVKPTPVVLPLQSQGEAICFTADSKSVLITSEFKRSTIWKVDLPAIEP